MFFWNFWKHFFKNIFFFKFSILPSYFQHKRARNSFTIGKPRVQSGSTVENRTTSDGAQNSHKFQNEFRHSAHHFHDELGQTTVSPPPLTNRCGTHIFAQNFIFLPSNTWLFFPIIPICSFLLLSNATV